MPIKHPTLKNKGLTLVECVMAILILSVTVVGGMMLYSNGNKIMSFAMQKKMALEMAVQEMEKIKGAGYSALPNPATGNWENLTDQPFGSFTLKVCKKITDISPIPNVLKKIELVVSLTSERCDQKMTKLESTEQDEVDSTIIKLETLISP